MQVTLLRKIEELILHLMDQHETITALQSELLELRHNAAFRSKGAKLMDIAQQGKEKPMKPNLLATNGSIQAGAPGLGVKEAIEPKSMKEFSHSEEVVLQNGFGAKTESDVTVRTRLEFLQMTDERHLSGSQTPSDRSLVEDQADLSGIIGNGSFHADIGMRRRST